MSLTKVVNSVLSNPFVWLAPGLCFAVLGVSFIAEIPKFRGQLHLIEQLTDFGVAQPGERTFLAGTVSEQNLPVYNQFIAYLREEYRSSAGRTSQWVEVARQTPPFILEVQDQWVYVANEDYALKTTDVMLEEATPTWTQGAVQARGFVVGSFVFAVGSKQKDQDFIAEFLYAGTRSDYVAYLSKSLRGRIWLGGGILSISLLLILWGAEQLVLYLQNNT